MSDSFWFTLLFLILYFNRIHSKSYFPDVSFDTFLNLFILEYLFYFINKYLIYLRNNVKNIFITALKSKIWKDTDKRET